MFEFASFLMQTDIFGAIEGLVIAAATLITTAGSLIVYAINKRASISKRDLTEQEKQIVAIAQASMLGAQKSVENIGQVKEAMKLFYDTLDLTPEQKIELENKLRPFIEETDNRLDISNRQAEIIKGILVQLLGPEGDVDNLATLPREGKEISLRLRNALPLPTK